VLDTAYFMPERPVMKMWESYLQTDGAKRLIRMESVAEVRDFVLVHLRRGGHDVCCLERSHLILAVAVWSAELGPRK
jgi:hypothetical protein